MDTHRCKHGHRYTEHPACYVREQLPKQKIGFLDIEASNLKANFGIVLSYCIKELDGPIISRVITKKELNKDLDKDLIAQCVKDIQKFDKIITFYGCMAPDHTILMADMSYKKLIDVSVGEEILAFDDDIPKSGYRRRFVKATVDYASLTKMPMVAIKLSDGTVLRVSSNHPFLIPNRSGNQANWKWRFASDLRVGDVVTRVCPEWEIDDTYEAGYLAASLDGEGYISLGPGVRMGFSQKDNRMLEKFVGICRQMDIKYHNYRPDDSVKKLTINGISDCFKVLGSVRPKRLLEKFYSSQLPSLNTPKEGRTTVVSVDDLGVGEVMGLSTTSGTYISNGFPSHNTRFDIPYLRSRALIHNIEFPQYGELYHEDVYYTARSKLCIHSNRLGVVEEVLFGETGKTRIDQKHWVKALMGDKEALDYILDHNERDVVSLEKVYKKLHEFKKETNRSM